MELLRPLTLTRRTGLSMQRDLGTIFVANGIDNAERRRAILLTSVGLSKYQLLKTLCLPDKPTAG